jgi:hypothetical protein
MDVFQPPILDADLATTPSLKWWPPLCAALAALAFPVLIEISSAFNLGGLFYFLIVAPVIVIIFLAVAIRMRSLHFWLVPIVFCLISWWCWNNSYLIRAHGRWLVASSSFKGKVLSQAVSASGELKHMEWDGWGFAGAGDTTVYLVYDPTDSLALATRREHPGKLKGVPCQVFRVNRLENNWYSVRFYTGTDWNHCS